MLWVLLRQDAAIGHKCRCYHSHSLLSNEPMRFIIGVHPKYPIFFNVM